MLEGLPKLFYVICGYNQSPTEKEILPEWLTQIFMLSEQFSEVIIYYQSCDGSIEESVVVKALQRATGHITPKVIRERGMMPPSKYIEMVQNEDPEATIVIDHFDNNISVFQRDAILLSEFESEIDFSKIISIPKIPNSGKEGLEYFFERGKDVFLHSLAFSLYSMRTFEKKDIKSIVKTLLDDRKFSQVHKNFAMEFSIDIMKEIVRGNARIFDEISKKDPETVAYPFVIFTKTFERDIRFHRKEDIYLKCEFNKVLISHGYLNRQSLLLPAPSADPHRSLI